MFNLQYIKINEHGIDLLKNNQFYKHIDFISVEKIYIEKGHYVNNWVLSLILGILVSITAFIWGYNSMISNDFFYSYHRSYILKNFVAPWILFVFGIILIYQSSRKCIMISIFTEGRYYKIPLKGIKKTDMLSNLSDFLKERVKVYKYNESIHEKTVD